MDQIELKTANNKEYKLEAIRDSVVYASKLKSGYLPRFYYFVYWKDYSEEKNIWSII